MSLKLKVIALPVVMIILAITIMIWMAYNISSSSLENETRQSLSSAQLTTADRIDSIKQRLDTASTITRIPELINGVKEKNSAALQPLTKQLLSDLKVDFITITDSDGTVIARGHSDKTGDSASKRPSFIAAVNGKKYSDILSSKDALVKLSLRQSYPIKDNGKIIGTIEYGADMASKDLLDGLKKILEMEVSIYQGDKPLFTTVPEEKQQLLNIGTIDAETSNSVLQQGKAVFKEVKTNGDSYSELYWPITSSQGNIGIYSIAKSNQTATAGLHRMLRDLGLYGAVIVLILLIISYFLGSAIERTVAEQNHWYDQILNKLRAPVSAVDMKMKPVFMNKSALDIAGNGAEFAAKGVQTAKSCAQIWRTALCGTKQCPLANLQNTGSNLTSVNLLGADFEIEAYYLENLKGEKIGMFEVLNDVSEKCQIQRVAKEISSVSSELDISCTEVSTASESLSQGATDQAAALEEVTATMTQIESQITANAENAVKASKLTGEATELASRGKTQMEQMVSAMEQITENSTLTQNIIKTIDDIAFQTNLLALNAAVEAARAGHHGKGFAVVAEEVRNLASRSAKATAETSQLVDKSNSQIHDGMDITRTTAESLLKITEVISNVNELASSIAVASNEQAQGISQVNIGLNQVDNVMQQNAVNAQETADSASRLAQQEETLNQLVRQF